MLLVVPSYGSKVTVVGNIILACFIIIEIFGRDVNGLMRFNNLCQAKSALTRPGAQMNGLKIMYNSSVQL